MSHRVFVEESLRSSFRKVEVGRYKGARLYGAQEPAGAHPNPQKMGKLVAHVDTALKEHKWIGSAATCCVPNRALTLHAMPWRYSQTS